MIDLANIKNIYFSGIGGIGMSALAKFLKEKGKVVSGSDLVKTPLTVDLQKKNIEVKYSQISENIDNKYDLFVYSPAIQIDNPEYVKATELNIPKLSYPELLGKLAENYYTIAITGTHGKSTTTALTALALENCGLDPNVIIGTKI